MEKYKLGDNIILTTIERYEKEFKALGYKPYKETKLYKETKTEKITEQEEKFIRRKRKED